MLHSNLRTLNADRRGAVAIMVSIMAAVLITCASLGVEVVLALRTQSAMQTAADSAALAAAVAGVMGYPTESEQGTAVALAAGFGGSNWNTPPDCLSTSAATLPFIYVGTPCDGPHQGDRNYVEAFLEMNFPLRLARVLFGGDFVVHGRAVATVQSSEVCMVVLEPFNGDGAASGSAFKVNGGTPVALNGCQAYVNSNTIGTGSSAAASVTNNSTLTCNPLVVGGVTQPGGLLVGGNATGVDTTLCPLTQNVPPIADPFGTISPYFMTSIPTIAAGTSPTGAITPVSASNPNGLKPVALPGGINQTSSASVTKICPGIYVIDGAPPANGQFKVTGGTVKSLTSNVALTASYDPLFSVDCPGDSGGGVAFVLTSSGSTSKIPNVQISGATTVIDLNGIDSTQSGNSELPVETLFWQNRQASSSGSGASDSFAGVTNLSGLLYFPTGNINFNGNPTVASPCFQMIAWTLNIGGGPTVTANGCLAGYKKIPPPSVLTE